MTNQAVNTEYQNTAEELEALLSSDPVSSLFDPVDDTQTTEAEAVEGDIIEGELVADEVQAEELAADELDALTAAVEMEEVREEVHASQEADSTPADLSAVDAKPKKTAKKAEGEASKRINTAGMKPSEIIRAKLGARMNDFLTLEMADADLKGDALEAKIESYLAEFDSLPKKVGEKVINVLMHLADGVDLSNYTAIALNQLAKGSTTTKEVREVYLKRPYTPGTANAQLSQMMTLLPALRIATRTGSTLTVNSDSALAAMLLPSA